MTPSSSDRTSDAAPITREELDALMAMLRKLAGTGADTDTSSAPTRKLTIREQRAQQQPPVAPELSSYGLTDVPEPRRQRKERHMEPRNVYSAKRVITNEAIRALRGLPPASLTIFAYLGGHPRATVPQIVAALDIRQKTVTNALSLMGRRDLVISERR